MLKKLCAVPAGIFCIFYFLQAVSARAQMPFDYFVTTDMEQNLAEYYYYINGVRHHVPADFSMTNEKLFMNCFFIEREFYIKNDMPIKIKLANNAYLSAMYSPAELYVAGVDDTENPQQYCLVSRNSKPTVFTAEELEPFMIDEKFELGDILCPGNLNVRTPDNDFITIDFFPPANYEKKAPNALVVGGSLLENPEFQEFSVYSKNEDFLTIQNTGNGIYSMYAVPEHFITFPMPEFSELEKNDKVNCIMRNNQPVMLYTPEISPTGDADGNQEVDILDVILINKAILGKETLPSERIPYIDFNYNQVPDASDSMMILKIIVGLENF